MNTGSSPELDQEWPDSSSKPAAAPLPRRSTRPNLHRSTGERFKVLSNGLLPARRPYASATARALAKVWRVAEVHKS